MSDSIFDLGAVMSNGKAFPFKDFSGKAMLIVNTATKCGFAYQYKGLEALHRTYGQTGLVVVGFPCDQFAHQEPESDGHMAAACEINFGVTFPLMAKIDVNGAHTHPVFRFLKSKAPGFLGSRIKWNFTKFLVSPDGATVRRYAPSIEPEALQKDIEAALR